MKNALNYDPKNAQNFDNGVFWVRNLSLLFHIKALFTHSGDLDCFYLRKKFETSRSKLTFVCWLRSAKIPQILILNKVELALPSTFSLLTNDIQ